jgi:dephospho-CoA kinase
MSMPTILAFVGLPMTGKSTARELTEELLSEKGIAWQKIYFGGVVVDEVARRDKEHLWNESESALSQQEKEKIIRESLRSEHGLGAMAKLCMPQIEAAHATGNVSLIDDLYSEEEREILVEKYGEENVLLVAMAADWNVRVRRAKNRPHRPLTEQELALRDDAEIRNLHKAPPIARAHVTITNNVDELTNPAGARDNLRSEIMVRVLTPILGDSLRHENK